MTCAEHIGLSVKSSSDRFASARLNPSLVQLIKQGKLYAFNYTNNPDTHPVNFNSQEISANFSSRVS